MRDRANNSYKLVINGEIRVLSRKEWDEAVEQSLVRLGVSETKREKPARVFVANAGMSGAVGLVSAPAHDAAIMLVKTDPPPLVQNLAPALGEKLLSFIVSPERLEAVMGDLEQGYRRLVERHGPVHAKRWYYWHVIGISFRGLLKGISRTLWDYVANLNAPQ